MNYRLEWRLVGRASRLLDHGEIDGDLADRTSALEALHAFLLTFAVRCTARGFLDTRYCYAAARIGASAANHSRLV